MSKFYSIKITTDTFDTNFKMEAYQEQNARRKIYCGIHSTKSTNEYRATQITI